MSCVCYAFASVHCCLVVTCWERADLLTLVGNVYCIFVTFSCGILGQVWYLIVSFPDRCRLSYFVYGVTNIPRSKQTNIPCKLANIHILWFSKYTISLKLGKHIKHRILYPIYGCKMASILFPYTNRTIKKGFTIIIRILEVVVRAIVREKV